MNDSDDDDGNGNKMNGGGFVRKRLTVSPLRLTTSFLQAAVSRTGTW